MEFLPWVQALALVYTVIQFLQMLRHKDTNGWFTQLVVWLAGVGVLLLVAETDFAGGISIGDHTLDTLNFASKVFVGLTIGASASLVKEGFKAFDNSDTQKKPPLLK